MWKLGARPDWRRPDADAYDNSVKELGFALGRKYRSGSYNKGTQSKSAYDDETNTRGVIASALYRIYYVMLTYQRKKLRK